MKRYAIWDKKSPIIVPTGKIYTAEEWIEKYPVAALEHITVICSAGDINGGVFDTLGNMVMRYEDDGCDFSACITAQEKLDVIETFEAERAAVQKAKSQEKVAATAMNEELTATSLASIAASMEYQNMMTLPDEEV